jgi:UDP-2,3-diacylglucosamine hydrolase
MRRFTFMPHYLFISDLHLSADEPHSMAAFLYFVAEIAPQAEALYILGDLFEYWAGDDDLADPFHTRVIAALRSLDQHHTPLFLLHGNRDLLMGKTLAEASHACLLDDPTLLNLFGTPTLLSHGDTLCTDDAEYQRYRATVHDAAFQQQFLAKPLAERKAFIAQLRARSQAEKQSKDSMIMDVNKNTHRPNRHEHEVDGKTCERWVLADWHQTGSALRCDAQGCSVITFQAC